MNTTQQKDKTMTLDEWNNRYLGAVIAVADGSAKPTDEMEDGFAGFVLDGILAIKDVEPHHELSDWDLVEHIADFCEMSAAIQERF
jgi:hypothetical protein